MLFLTLKSSFLAALTISTIARLVTYAATCIALPVFRARPEVPRAGVSTAGRDDHRDSFAVVDRLVVDEQHLAEAKVAAVAGGVGLLIYFAYRLYSK